MLDVMGFGMEPFFTTHRRRRHQRLTRHMEEFEDRMDRLFGEDSLSLRNILNFSMGDFDDISDSDEATPGCHQYVYRSSYSSNGDDVVEERHEEVTEEDGSTRCTTKRRLGDRWCEKEVHTDKDGQQTSKETWYNVPEDQIEAFKKEWDTNHAGRIPSGSSAPAIEHKEE